MSSRYLRNKNTINDVEQTALRHYHIAVVGLGGLGGHIAEQLARLGIGELSLIDCDTVDLSNLNRQIFATETTIGMSKTKSAKLRLTDINSKIKYNFFDEFLNETNAQNILQNCHIIMDASDNIKTRYLLQTMGKSLNIPLIHGAIAGWYGQVTTIAPGDETFSKLYNKNANKGIETEIGNPAFIPALVASIQVAEALKWLFHREKCLSKKVLRIDLLNNEYEIIELE